MEKQETRGRAVITSLFDAGTFVETGAYVRRPGETYELEHPVEGRPDTVTMGPDDYFACGDNFNNSYDSRYWGPVPRKNLRGSASFVFWPFNGWRIIR
mgnify:CR=1 FL=1